LMNREEVKVMADEAPEIVHHAVLKADVRGSTTVTEELMNQNLNPASYFSLRFFNPINEQLAVFDANKVFIEGDAVILSTYELEQQMTQWYAVSRICGMAIEMLDIVKSRNADASQTNLPALEIGIGICYSPTRPLFLFDEDRPIMISKAIGEADRMSSCSWRLRSTLDAGEFNVDVLLLDDGDAQRGEKGQTLLRYNVNGILLDSPAFEKLLTEVNFRRMKLKVADESQVFYIGKFPDIAGRERYLVVREGKVRLFKDDVIQGETGEVFHEVLPNGKLTNQIVKLAESKQDDT